MDFKADAQRMEKIVSLCKRRGFIFQSSEIYGGLNGCWDYGPLGVELKRNVKDYWWRVTVRERDDVVGMDGAILMSRAVWKASGHEETFTDPMVDCRTCKARLRADQLPEKNGVKQCPNCGGKDLTAPRAFNLMVKTFVGGTDDEGAAYRTDYDLKQHQEASGKPLDYFDEETKQRFIPHVVEPSAGVDRTVLALLCNAYDEETVTDEKGKAETRIVMRFHPRIAPVKVGVFPLLKNNEQLVAKAREIVALLRPSMNVFYDETGAIGRRYRRQDEAGTPFGVTVDFETLGEKDATLRDTVTLRERDSMKQERVAINDLAGILTPRIS